MLSAERVKENPAQNWQTYLEQLPISHGQRLVKLRSLSSLSIAQEAVNEAFLAVVKKIRIHLITTVETMTTREPRKYKTYQALLDKTNNNVVTEVCQKMRAAVSAQTETNSVSQNLLGVVLDLLYDIPYAAIRDHQTLNQDFINLLRAIIQLENFIKKSSSFSTTKASARSLEKPLVIDASSDSTEIGPQNKANRPVSQVLVPSITINRRNAVAGILLVGVGSALVIVSSHNSSVSTGASRHSINDNLSPQPEIRHRRTTDAGADHGIYTHALTTYSYQVPGHTSVFKPTLMNFFITQVQLARTCIPRPFANIAQLVDRLDNVPPISKNRLHALARNAHATNSPFTIMWTADCKQFRFVPGNTVLQRTMGAIVGEIVITLNQD